MLQIRAGWMAVVMAVSHLLLLVWDPQPPAASPAPEPPRYVTTGGLELLRSGAQIRDSFDDGRIDESRWRVWTSDPASVSHEERAGRYWLRVEGKAGYNGLVSRTEMSTRDVVAVCLTGVESSGGAMHASIVHLCGSGPWSPDHWYEVALLHSKGRSATASSAVAVPLKNRDGYHGPYELPGQGEAGHLVRIECEAAGHRCRGLVAVGREWWQIGDWFEVPARTSRLEIKTSGTNSGQGSSTIWFDDCRVYPAPRAHYVTVVLRDADGGIPGASGGGDGARDCLDGKGGAIHGCGFQVALHDQDGTLVDETDTEVGFGYALLKLDLAPWDIYPAGAIIRVSANGRQMGPDHVIERRGVEGLYPDDVYAITLE